MPSDVSGEIGQGHTDGYEIQLHHGTGHDHAGKLTHTSLQFLKTLSGIVDDRFQGEQVLNSQTGRDK